MYSWGDTISSDFDITDTSFLNIYTYAIKERALTTNYAPFVAVSTGVDVQAASFWSYYQGSIIGLLDTTDPSSSTVYSALAWVIPGTSFDNLPGVVARILGGYRVTLNFKDKIYSKTGAFTSAGVGNSGDFTRKLPREINTTTATTDTAGNTIVNGNIARLTTSGAVYKRVSGAWQLTNEAGPDIITKFGFIQSGDYLIHEIGDEPIEIAKLLNRSIGTTGGNVSLAVAKTPSSTGNYSTRSAAISAALGYYHTAQSSASYGSYRPLGSLDDTDCQSTTVVGYHDDGFGGDSYTVDINTVANKFQLQSTYGNLLSNVPRHIKIYQVGYSSFTYSIQNATNIPTTPSELYMVYEEDVASGATSVSVFTIYDEMFTSDPPDFTNPSKGNSDEIGFILVKGGVSDITYNFIYA